MRPSLPRPTYWPMFLALGIVGIAWGLVTSWIVTAMGGAVLLAATIGWMKEVSG